MVEVGAEMTNIVKVKIEKRNKDFRKIMHEKVDEICDLLEDGGEMSDENLVFKVLRRNGYIQKLFDFQNEYQDKKLSLKEKSI